MSVEILVVAATILFAMWVAIEAVTTQKMRDRELVHLRKMYKKDGNQE